MCSMFFKESYVYVCVCVFISLYMHSIRCIPEIENSGCYWTRELFGWRQDWKETQFVNLVHMLPFSILIGGGALTIFI